MKRHTAHGLALAGLLVGGFPLALAAQESEINADNTPYGTTSGEFLLLGASARGAALGNAFQAIANDVSALYYNPAGISHDGTPRGAHQHVLVRGGHPLQLGRPGLPVLGRRPGGRPPPRHLRLQGPAGIHGGPARRHRRRLLRQRVVHRTHLRRELLGPVLGGHHRQGRVRPARRSQRERLRGGLRHQFPFGAEQPPDQVLLRHPEPRHQPQLQRRRAQRGRPAGAGRG